MKKPSPISLKEIATQYNVCFVHGIRTQKGTEISLLEKWVDWETMLELVLAFSPTLSASAIIDGCSDFQLWSGVGVILSGGGIVGAYPSDEATHPLSMYERSHGEAYMQQKRMKEAEERGRVLAKETEEEWKAFVAWAVPYLEGIQQKKALRETIPKTITKTEHETIRRNEFIIQNPEIAGIYICTNPEFQRWLGKSPPSLEDLLPVATRFHLPIFEIEEGRVYKTETINASIKRREQVKHREYQHITISEQERAAILKKIDEDSPFKLEEINKDAKWKMNSYFAGRRTYVEGIVRRNVDFFFEVNHNTRKPRTELVLREPGYMIVYRVHEKEVVKKEILRNTARGKEYRTVKVVDIYGRHEESKERPYQPMHASGHIPDEKILEALEKEIREGHEQWKEEFAYHLYGFAAQAECLGDTERAEKARSIASQVIPYEEAKAFIESRISKQGTLKLTDEDKEYLGITA